MRILKSHPLLKMVNSYVIDSPQPSNISYLWNFGSLLGVCLIVQIVTGVTLAMSDAPCISMFYPVVYLFPSLSWETAFDGAHSVDILDYCNLSSGTCTCLTLPLMQRPLSLHECKNKILSIKENKIKSADAFYEWLRGFTDGEGYFLIKKTSRKVLNKSGEIITYISITFSFVLHLSIKDVDVLYTIQKWLGGIGLVSIDEKGTTASLMVTGKEDTDKLMKLMYDYFSNLNTTKVLDFFAWYEARNLYYKYQEEKDKNIPTYKDQGYSLLLNKVLSIRDSMNKSRFNFKFPESHKVNITKEWLLGFIEGEGCFHINNISVAFSLAQTSVNRYVLVCIKDYLQKFGDNLILTIEDCKPNKLKQKPYSVLYIGKGNNTAYIFISLIIDLPWLSYKVLNFKDWVVIYLLVSEGKHHLPEGKRIIANLKSRLGTKRELLDIEINKETIDLLYSASNYVESDHTGIFKVKINSKGLPGIMHKTGSYVLVTDLENSKSLKFKSNAECATYFGVSKVSVGRWITKNGPVSLQSKVKGTFSFKKS